MNAIIQQVSENLTHTHLNISYEEAILRIEHGGLIESTPSDRLSMILIIPAFAEHSLHPTIQSLLQTDKIEEPLELIILINEAEHVLDEHHTINQSCFDELSMYSNGQKHDMKIHVLYIHNIPKKIAGVGTARKMAMDEAARRLQSIERLRNGVIINLDADCAVSPNYFRAINSFFNDHPKAELANIHFEHRLQDASSQKEREAIVNYEVHLRYFIGMQRFIGLPYAFQTIGSAFAVRVDAYLGIGGMNRRKAGEDFYFIHKFTKKGTAKDLTTCTVFPSSRASFRVPFGTGRAVGEMLEQTHGFTTYHHQSFLDLLPLIASVDTLFTLNETSIVERLSTFPQPVLAYLKSKDFVRIIIKLRSNAKTILTFRKAFFHWFDAFQLMKYLHFARDHHYANLSVEDAVINSLDMIGLRSFEDLESCLRAMRFSDGDRTVL